ncbi:Uncharacterised protein [uncultured Clostridium sp.]|uniref:hypothetical protein n=1 Tax=uncultured Clostridium sp. TaxID=59620 RepID=UPI000821948B|nr:hypothetical protein [uncultured Clostridium sp.]SCJ93277.1 Uncharacterised protein [uncultured Clostridium sp.]
MKNNIKIPDLDFNDMEKILNSGVRKRNLFIKYLRDVYKELGFRNIFHDKNELIFIIIIAFIILNISTVSFIESNINEINKFTFITSPILYLVTSVFSFYNSKEKGAFEIEMTCKYNLYQLSAIRMFIFSILTALLNTFMILAGSLINKDINIIRLICISITGLFLFSAIFLYSLITFKNRIVKVLVIAGWVLLNLFLSSFNSSVYNEFLAKVPIYIHLIITAVCIVLYVRSLNKLINLRRKKGEI